MKKIGEFIKKHRKGVIALAVILVIIIIISVFVHRTKKKAEEMLAGMAQETYVLEKRDLVKSVSGTGKITSGQRKDVIVSTITNTKIATVDVELGDTVKAGDILCTFDTEDIERNLANAKTDLEISQKKTANNMDNQTRGLHNTRIDAVNETNRNLEKLDKAQRIYDTELGEEAEASRIYDEVEDIYEDYWDEDEYYELLESYEQVKHALEPYEGRYDSLATEADFKTEEEKADFKYYKQLLSDSDKLSNRITNMERAKGKLDNAKSSEDTARNSANTAEENLESAKERQEDEFRKDVNGVRDAENNYENAKLDSSVANRPYEENVQKYEEQLEDATVRAPIDGIVTAINYEPGEMYAGQALITVEDLSSYVIEADIDEYDISKVAVGQKVKFKTNATGDEEMDAVVTEIAPRATTAAPSTGSSGAAATASTSAYRVKMLIETRNSDLRLDMTAKINIIVDSADNVYAVPFAAVQTDESGNKYIEIEDDSADAAVPTYDKEDMKDPEKQQEAVKAAMNAAAGNAPTKRIYVTVGVETDYYVEIESPELYDGMSVVVPASGGGMDELMTMMGAMGGM